eukprot:255869-Pleurochrysis_carterae.AAC.2
MTCSWHDSLCAGTRVSLRARSFRPPLPTRKIAHGHPHPAARAHARSRGESHATCTHALVSAQTFCYTGQCDAVVHQRRLAHTGQSSNAEANGKRGATLARTPRRSHAAPAVLCACAGARTRAHGRPRKRAGSGERKGMVRKCVVEDGS